MKNFGVIKKRLKNWWDNNEQDKAIILGTVYDKPFPEIKDIGEYWESNEIRFNIFKDRISSAEFYGCAIPYHYIDFGSSAMAGALGCKMNPLTFDTVWPSHKFNSLPKIDEINVVENSKWYKALYNLIEISAEDTEISTSFYALGGINDTLGSLYGEQNLLIDMYDDPEKVHKCLEKICNIWLAEKEKMWNIIKQKQEGMSSWAGIWAPGSTFPIQDDISFMLSKEMFDEFCIPYIKKCIDSLDYPIYHLDGPGAIKHLDSLLNIENLHAIQWVPGAGNEEITQWVPLIKKVIDSGKSIQVFCNVEEVEELVNKVGNKGLLIYLRNAKTDNITKLNKYF